VLDEHVPDLPEPVALRLALPGLPEQLGERRRLLESQRGRPVKNTLEIVIVR
jgi:hypothetical protein